MHGQVHHQVHAGAGGGGEMKIIEICSHSRVTRIPSPPEDNLRARMEWLHDRFGASLSAELIPEAMMSIIRRFDNGMLKGLTAFEFELIVRAEVDEHN